MYCLIDSDEVCRATDTVETHASHGRTPLPISRGQNGNTANAGRQEMYSHGRAAARRNAKLKLKIEGSQSARQLRAAISADAPSRCLENHQQPHSPKSTGAHRSLSSMNSGLDITSSSGRGDE